MSWPAFSLELEGPVRPYVRMTQRSKWVKKDAQAYMASIAALKAQMKAQRGEAEMLPARTPLWCRIRIVSVRKFHRCDLDNQVKAILDAATGILFPDDRWVDRLAASRRLGERDVVYLWISTIREEVG